MIGSISLAQFGILFAQSAWQPTQNVNTALTEAAQENEAIAQTVITSTAKKHSYEKEFVLAFANPDEIGDLIVDINRGGITIEGYDGREIKVKLTVPNYEPSSAGKSSDGLVQLRSSSPDFDITQSGNRIKIDSSDYRYISNLEIKVPKQINLSLDSYRNGDIRVTGTAGELRIHTQNNDVFLTNVSGFATGWSYNGSFEATFESVTKGKPISLESYNGSIDISLPSDFRADTKFRSATGKLLTNFNVEPQEQPPLKTTNQNGDATIELDEFVLGKINGGGPQLSLETEKGDISIRKRMTTEISDDTNNK